MGALYPTLFGALYSGFKGIQSLAGKGASGLIQFEQVGDSLQLVRNQISSTSPIFSTFVKELKGSKSVTKAIGKQVWITKKSQSNALVRLNRYELDINKFYDGLDCDKFEFIKQLRIDARNQENVAITTSILTLIDEVNLNLINKKQAHDLAYSILENCNSCPMKTILKYWINYFIQD